VSAAERQPHYAVTGEPLVSAWPQDRVPLGGDGRVTWGLENVHAAMVGRTVRSAREGIGPDSTDPSFVIRREAQLLISYADSTIVGPDGGARAPDASGLPGGQRHHAVVHPAGPRYTSLLYAGNAAGADDVAGLESAADAVLQAAHGQMDVYLVAAPDADMTGTCCP